MIYNNVILTVKNRQNIDTVRELLAEQARRSSEEPGCERFEVYQSQADAALFMLVEQWTTQEDLDRHKQAAAFTQLYLPKVIPLVDRVPHPSELVWP
ncbi:MAG: hypothetical protein DHS20C12_27950 [Pseudohongiella sp.]|nr:MAG: hypothetical protein DHS20C12_27950 [Pseudohongiella sp.]